MPECTPWRPRQMLPPPTTIAMSSSSSERTATISLATWVTISPEMP
jgi:hypothetical protein